MILLSELNREELAEIVRSVIKQELTIIKPLPNLKLPEQLSRKETAKVLNISLPTLDRYAKTGMIRPTKFGSRVTFSEEEITRVLEFFTLKHL